GVAMLVAIVAVGRLVGPVGAVAAIECIAHRFLRLLPGQLRLFLGVLPSGADFAFQRIVPAAPGVLFAHGVAVGVGRRVVVVAVLAVDVGPVLVFAAPVLGFARRVDAFGHALAGGGPGNRAGRTADQHADRSGQCTDRGPGRGAADPADADADGMRSGCVADRVAVHVTVLVCHGGTPRCGG